MLLLAVLAVAASSTSASVARISAHSAFVRAVSSISSPGGGLCVGIVFGGGGRGVEKPPAWIWGWACGRGWGRAFRGGFVCGMDSCFVEGSGGLGVVPCRDVGEFGASGDANVDGDGGVETVADFCLSPIVRCDSCSE